MNFREKIILIQKVNIIQNRKVLNDKLREEFGTDYDLMRASIEGDLIKDSAIIKISGLVPTCFSIGDKVFIEGDTKKEAFDYCGDGFGFGDSIELQDITTEMATGNSYSFYVSNTDHFTLATESQVLKVMNFFNTI